MIWHTEKVFHFHLQKFIRLLVLTKLKKNFKFTMIWLRNILKRELFMSDKMVESSGS